MFMHNRSPSNRLQSQTRDGAEGKHLPSRQLPTQQKVWLHPENGDSRLQVKRRFAIGMTFVTVLSFIYFITSERDFFDVRAKDVSVLGNEHYEAIDIVGALELSPNQSNVPEQEIENRLKRKLRYVKKVDVSKSGVVKPNLTVQITERKPIAWLKYHLNHEVRFLQVDPDGYVLEDIDSPQTSDTFVTIVADGQGQLPERDSQVHSEDIQLALSVLHSAQSLTPEIASKLRTINANQPEKIILQLDDLPVVWLSSDLINTGLYHIDLFLKNRTTIVKQKKRNRMKGYLDARFQDAIYWGGKHG
jgi:cell division septal protein FtsQ